MTYDELINNPNYILHHISWASGYLRKKLDRTVIAYKGRYGKGYAVEIRTTSTRCHRIAYYIEK